MLPVVTAAAVATLGRIIVEAEKNKAEQRFGMIPQDLAPEASTALSLLSVIQRVCDASGADIPAEVQAGINAAAGIAAFDFGGGSMRLPGKAIAIVEACFELATRAVFRDLSSLAVVLGAGPDVESRQVAATSRLVEV